MIGQSHYAVKNIHMKVKFLQNNFSHLKDLVDVRGDRLKDAVQSLQVKITVRNKTNYIIYVCPSDDVHAFTDTLH